MTPRARLAGSLAVLLVLGAVAAILLGSVLGPTGVTLVAFAASGIGATLVGRHMATRRFTAVTELAGDRLDAYPGRLALDRVAVGPVLQSRFNRHYAPGVLGFRSGHAEFFPAKPEHADRAWAGAVGAVQLRGLYGYGTVIRLHSPTGPVQLATSLPRQEVRSAFGDLLRVDEGWSAEDPTR